MQAKRTWPHGGVTSALLFPRVAHQGVLIVIRSYAPALAYFDGIRVLHFGTLSIYIDT
jgi:hypothetical protein